MVRPWLFELLGHTARHTAQPRPHHDDAASQKRVLTWQSPSPGFAVRAWQLGIQMQPLYHKSTVWAYPVFGACGASFGYWMQGVDESQTAVLNERKKAILDKRARRAQREQEAAGAAS